MISSSSTSSMWKEPLSDMITPKSIIQASLTHLWVTVYPGLPHLVIPTARIGHFRRRRASAAFYQHPGALPCMPLLCKEKFPACKGHIISELLSKPLLTCRPLSPIFRSAEPNHETDSGRSSCFSIYPFVAGRSFGGRLPSCFEEPAADDRDREAVRAAHHGHSDHGIVARG